jgi:hypothetical protein
MTQAKRQLSVDMSWEAEPKKLRSTFQNYYRCPNITNLDNSGISRERKQLEICGFHHLKDKCGGIKLC